MTFAGCRATSARARSSAGDGGAWAFGVGLCKEMRGDQAQILRLDRQTGTCLAVHAAFRGVQYVEYQYSTLCIIYCTLVCSPCTHYAPTSVCPLLSGIAHSAGAGSVASFAIFATHDPKYSSGRPSCHECEQQPRGGGRACVDTNIVSRRACGGRGRRSKTSGRIGRCSSTARRQNAASGHPEAM